MPHRSGLLWIAASASIRRLEKLTGDGKGPWLCSWAVRIAERDKRRRTHPSFPGLQTWEGASRGSRVRFPEEKGGSSTQPGPGSPAATSVRKRRSKPAFGGQAAGTVAGSLRSRILAAKRLAQARRTRLAGVEERALVVGRRAGLDPTAVFDETVVKAGSGDHPREPGREVGFGEVGATRTPEARQHARCAAENAAHEKPGAEELSIEAPPGPRRLDSGAPSRPRPRTFS